MQTEPQKQITNHELDELLPKQYHPETIEEALYQEWTAGGYFHASAIPGKPSYCLTIPPPNVTGSLHMGHALCYTIHDVLIRWKRMQGIEALCLPGTDHAGIATQNVVERMLAEKSVTRHELGREAFVKEVWKWRQQYGSAIIGQMKKLGCSFDWERERFTMDEGYSHAVLEAFIHLFNKGLHRGTRVTNWCPRCRTAISDIEVDNQETAGSLWYFKYPLEHSVNGIDHLTIATTRPETMLGDTAVAVHPDDPRYQAMVGQTIMLPIMNQPIPIVADPVLVDMEFGTGALKVTPAHDFNDFEAGERNHLPQITVIGPDGKMTEEAGEFAGMDRMTARAAIVHRMQQIGLLVKTEDYTVTQPICDRCKTLLEPLLSEQWFCRMQELAAPAIEAVRNESVQFVPARWGRVYLDWMEKLRDWCVSRQLWWGHRIPVYYCDGCGKAMADRQTPDRCQACGHTSFTQDPDVLDTWFSSALWPFATLGWPDKTPELDCFYPTDALITAPEIIYLWVARMIFQGLEFMGEKPFKDVYIYATVLDGHGDRMSKSKGNGIDPLLLVQKYGADATRYAIVTQAGKTQQFRFAQEKQCPNVKCAEWSLFDAEKCPKCGKKFTGQLEWRAPQVELAKHFCNKIWQASRFVLGSLNGEMQQISPAAGPRLVTLEDRWIFSRLAGAIQSVSSGLETYDLDVATRVLHEFVWSEFCDWYIELAKPRIAAGDTAVQQNLVTILNTLLALLHPFIPFVTEEIWLQIPGNGKSLMVAEFPSNRPEWMDATAEQTMLDAIDLVVKIRNIRAELHVKPGLRAPVFLSSVPNHLREALTIVEGRARCSVTMDDLSEERMMDHHHFAVSSSGSTQIRIPLEGLVDFEAENARLVGEITSIEKEIAGINQQLTNEQFLTRAPQVIVEEKRNRYKELVERLRHAEEARRRLA